VSTNWSHKQINCSHLIETKRCFTIDFQKMDSKTPLSKVHGVNKMKNRKYHTVRTVPKSNIKIVEIGKFVTPNTQMHDSLLTWLCMGT
jgi:hypothetical protein